MLKKDIQETIKKACPLMIRLAWHSAGTYDTKDGSGGSNGATMRHKLEASDDANNGLDIARKMLNPIKSKHGISYSDLWSLSGTIAIELMGGPSIEHVPGRIDKDETQCPANGRLPDGSLGAQHLRDIFYRMGFNDQEIVALSGAHTVGSCHKERSGFQGAWTTNPYVFDNQYFQNLLKYSWTLHDGQYKSNGLIMLPTDMALIKDEGFKPYVEKYAKYQLIFFKDFEQAFHKLMMNGHPSKL